MHLRSLSTKCLRTFACFLLIASLVNFGASSATAQQGFVRGGAVGGILVDTDGVLSAPEADATGEVLAAWKQGLDPAPAELEKLADLRFVSLKGIEQQLALAAETGAEIPDSVRYMAGLLRVEYVLFYPEKNDIVLAGPAEGWSVDTLGNVVGSTSRRPVLLLEDLMVALRAAENANGNGISCSIDPTSQGLANVQKLIRHLGTNESPVAASKRLEQALGPQVVSVSGVPASSHFARTMVAADFRMKRLAMGFEPAPISSLPSYLDLIPSRSTAIRNMLPRWWLAANYEPMLASPNGNAWQIRGQGVKCMTEEDVADAAGNRTRTGRAGKFAQKWADLMTENFEELASHDSSFGQLRNVFDLAVAAAVIAQNRAMANTGLTAPQLTGQQQLAEYPTPRRVASRANFVKKGNRWVVTASGGVQVYPWEISDRSEQSDTLADVRKDAIAKNASNWWWQ